MTEKKRRISRSLALICSLALLMTARGLSAAPLILTVPAEIIRLDATQDTYTNINQATTNFDERLLSAANSPGNAPHTSASPPVFEKGTASLLANRMFTLEGSV